MLEAWTRACGFSTWMTQMDGNQNLRRAKCSRLRLWLEAKVTMLACFSLSCVWLGWKGVVVQTKNWIASINCEIRGSNHILVVPCWLPHTHTQHQMCGEVIHEITETVKHLPPLEGLQFCPQWLWCSIIVSLTLPIFGSVIMGFFFTSKRKGLFHCAIERPRVRLEEVGGEQGLRIWSD